MNGVAKPARLALLLCLLTSALTITGCATSSSVRVPPPRQPPKPAALSTPLPPPGSFLTRLCRILFDSQGMPTGCATAPSSPSAASTPASPLGR